MMAVLTLFFVTPAFCIASENGSADLKKNCCSNKTNKQKDMACCKKKNCNTGSTIKFKGNNITTSGCLPKVGEQAPDAVLTNKGLEDVKISSFFGKTVILNIFPSLDTPTCATSVRTFNKIASELPNTVVLCISMDLPFAASRFCTTDGLNNVIALSGFRSDFGKVYGVELADLPLKGLYTRAIVIIDENGKVAYTELVEEISKEPNYNEAINCVKKL